MAIRRGGWQSPTLKKSCSARRPDIGCLPLTCENTNIALPYLDLVNETLEYYVANTPAGSLTGYQGYSDDGTVSSAELTASPQNDDNPTAQSAYEILKTQWFPPPLPFYRDLELLRQHIARFGISLYDVMEALRTTDDLESPTPSDPGSYGWRDILAERLRLSASAKILGRLDAVESIRSSPAAH